MSNQSRVRGSSPGYYYILADQFMQDSNSGAITITLPMILGTPEFEYKAGIQLVFETTHLNGNVPGTVTINVNNKGVKRLLTRYGEEFKIGELDAGVTLTATYNGTDFHTDLH